MRKIIRISVLILTIATMAFAAYAFNCLGQGKDIKLPEVFTEAPIKMSFAEEKTKYLEKQVLEPYTLCGEEYSTYVYSIPGDFEHSLGESDSDGNYSEYTIKNESFPVYEYGDFTVREIMPDAIEISKYNGCDQNIVIPSAINGKTVRYIGKRAFCESDIVSGEKISGHKIESVCVPQSVLFIGDEAFYGCESLKEVTFPERLVYIGMYAFENCPKLSSVDIKSCEVFGASSFAGCSSLTSLILPSDTKLLLCAAFSGCPIESLSLNNGLEFIDCAFAETKIKEVTIPSSVKVIFGGFESCRRLEKVYFEDSETPLLSVYDFVHECISLREIHFPSRMKNISTISESCLKMIRLTDIYFENADIEGIENSDLNVTGIKNIHAPAGGNIEEFCRYRLRMKFVPYKEA